MARRACGHLHCKILREHLVTAFELDENADSAHMRVRADRALALEHLEPAHIDVFADLCNQRLASRLEIFAVDVERHEGVQVGRRLAKYGRGNEIGEAAEVLVLSHEIRLGVDLDDGMLARPRITLDDDLSFGSHAGGFLVGFRLTGLSQVLRRGIEITVGLLQRPLAIHHAGARALTKLFHL